MDTGCLKLDTAANPSGDIAATMTCTPWRSAVFFDVDETIITAKSMFAFLQFWCETTDTALRYAPIAVHFGEMARSGIDRTEINRAYYRLFAGVAHTRLEQAGRAWYADYRERDDAYVAATLAAIERHQAAGEAIVMVSGGFHACLDPIAEEIGADLVLCTEPMLTPDGILTGEVVKPMIGTAKAAAARATMARLRLHPGDCSAYADHSSDLDMLSLTGHPHVIGADPTLQAKALQHGWPVLPADGRPAPATVGAG